MRRGLRHLYRLPIESGTGQRSPGPFLYLGISTWRPYPTATLFLLEVHSMSQSATFKVSEIMCSSKALMKLRIRFISGCIR